MLEKIFLLLYNVFVLLIPYSLNFMGLTYSKILFLYSILVTIYLIIKKKINKEIFKNTTLKYLTIGYLVFLTIVSISVIINTIIDKKIVFSNILEIFRVIEYYLTIINYYILSKNNKKIFKISFIIIFIFNIILAFFQFHNLFGLNELYVKFIAPTQYETLVNGYAYPRVVGFAGNPNVFGFFITLASIYILYLLLKNPKKWYYYLLYILLVISVFLSASRTSYIVLIIGSGLLILLNYFKLNKKDICKTLLIGIIFVAFQFVLLFILPTSYTWRIKQLIDLDSVTSWQNRLENNQNFIENIKDKAPDNNFPDNQTNTDKDNESNKNTTIPEENILPKEEEKNTTTTKKSSNKLYTYIIGNGPDKLKEKHEGYFDNEWFMIIFNYGFIGLITYIFMLIFPLFSIKKNKNFNYVLYTSLVFSTFIYMIAAASYNCYLLFNLFCILVAITIIDKNS